MFIILVSLAFVIPAMLVAAYGIFSEVSSWVATGKEKESCKAYNLCEWLMEGFRNEAYKEAERLWQVA